MIDKSEHKGFIKFNMILTIFIVFGLILIVILSEIFTNIFIDIILTILYVVGLAKYIYNNL